MMRYKRKQHLSFKQTGSLPSGRRHQTFNLESLGSIVGSNPTGPTA